MLNANLRQHGCKSRVPACGAVSLAFAVLVVGVGLFSATAAAADSVQISIQTATPEQGVPVTIAFSGSAAAEDTEGDPAVLVAVARPAGGLPCQSSEQNDADAAHSESTTLFQDDYFGGGYDGVAVGTGSFDQTAEFNPPAPGSYLICAWIEDENNSETTSAATSTTFSARGPQVEQLTVSLPQSARPNVAFQIAFTTQTDQQLNLYSVIKPSGGLPCASSYELESAQNQELDDLFGDEGQSVFGGPTTTTTTATEKGGSYVICTWVEGPNQEEVDATTSTSIYVGTPPAPPRCVVPTLRPHSSLAEVESQLSTAHCAAGATSEKHSKSVPTGDVIKLDPRARTKLANGAKVSIVVSTGPVPKRKHHRRTTRR
jgi:hypothetical protein